LKAFGYGAQYENVIFRTEPNINHHLWSNSDSRPVSSGKGFPPRLETGSKARTHKRTQSDKAAIETMDIFSERDRKEGVNWRMSDSTVLTEVRVNQSFAGHARSALSFPAGKHIGTE
jgi:hypothetical protein